MAMAELHSAAMPSDHSILIVEDDKSFLHRLSRAMEGRGFAVTMAETVAEGLNQLQVNSPAFAVVDMRLEDGNGLDVISALKRLRPDARAIILTGYGNIATAVTAVKLGAVNDGLAHLQQGIREWIATDCVTYQSYFFGLLAEALGDAREFGKARRLLDEALALVEHTDERLCEHELYRLRGELTLAGAHGIETNDLERVELDFTRAVAAARSQQAKSAELRTAMSLHRFERRIGKMGSARGELADTLLGVVEGSIILAKAHRDPTRIPKAIRGFRRSLETSIAESA